MELKEIKARAAQLKRENDLPMGILVNLTQCAWIANINDITRWRLPDDEQPQTMRIGGAELLQIDAAVAWADRYWQKRREREAARGWPYRTTAK